MKWNNLAPRTCKGWWRARAALPVLLLVGLAIPLVVADGAVPADEPVMDRAPVDDLRPLDGAPLDPLPSPVAPSGAGDGAALILAPEGMATVPSSWVMDPLVLGGLGGMILAALVTLVLVTRHQWRVVSDTRRDLRETRSRYKALFENIHEGVLISREGTILEVNLAMETLAGVPREDLVGTSLPDLVDVCEREMVVGRILSGDETPVMVTLVRSDGTSLPVEARARGVVYAGGPARMTTVRDMSARLRLEDRMRRLATVDTISECLNRRAFLDQAEVEFERFRRYGRILSVLMVDVDDLRGINAKDGYQAGDAVLRHLVRRCDALLRVSDAVGRYGGAECAMLLPETPLVGAVNVGERLCAAVRADGASFQQRSIPYVVRVGIGDVRPGDTSVIAALERAELAMRRAKKEGSDLIIG
ncbi:MAG: diguanylate cyclase [Rhodospirillum sp.]|nr:diguanylate cyclase [Rhodospirillum sp.]MCF8489551.1 diguanylate cyclase [Rhodospirillum sp.]MCF8499740.1 diguanylate cyclase [Rhodospirillum sp.]